VGWLYGDRAVANVIGALSAKKRRPLPRLGMMMLPVMRLVPIARDVRGIPPGGALLSPRWERTQ
jgi:hypothetical protein